MRSCLLWLVENLAAFLIKLNRSRGAAGLFQQNRNNQSYLLVFVRSTICIKRSRDEEFVGFFDNLLENTL